MVKKIINYVIEAISAWLQETPEETEERRAKRQDKLSKANAGKKILSLTGIFYFAELIALWAMSYAPMRACYGSIFQKVRPHAAAWADFLPRVVVVTFVILVAALLFYTALEVQSHFGSDESDYDASRTAENVIFVLLGLILCLMLITLGCSLLVSIADDSIMNTLNIITALLHPGKALYWLLLTALILAAISYFAYTIVTQTLWIIREMPSTIEAVKARRKARKLKKGKK